MNRGLGCVAPLFVRAEGGSSRGLLPFASIGAKAPKPFKRERCPSVFARQSAHSRAVDEANVSLVTIRRCGRTGESRRSHKDRQLLGLTD